MYPVLPILNEGCAKLEIPGEASRELVRWLTIKRLLGPEEGKNLSPSATLDKLLHWVLLNTEVRKHVELYLGELSHSTETAELDVVTKCKRRSTLKHNLHPYFNQVNTGMAFTGRAAQDLLDISVNFRAFAQVGKSQCHVF